MTMFHVVCSAVTCSSLTVGIIYKLPLGIVILQMFCAVVVTANAAKALGVFY